MVPQGARTQEFLRPLGESTQDAPTARTHSAAEVRYDTDIATAVREILYLAAKNVELDPPSENLKTERANLAFLQVPVVGKVNPAEVAQSRQKIDEYASQIAAIEADLGGHLEIAISQLEDAHRIHPELGLPIQYEGAAYLNARQYQRALYRYVRACAISVGHTGRLQPQLLLGLADTNTGLGYYLEADRLYKYIIAHYSDQPRQVAAATAGLEANQQHWDTMRAAAAKGPFGYNVTASKPEIALPPLPELVLKTGATFTGEGYVFTGVGYNDNIDRHPETTVLRPHQTPTEREEDFYNESSFSFSLDSRPFPRRYVDADGDAPEVIADYLSLNYVMSADTFGEYKSADRILQTVYASYTRPLSNSFGLAVKISDQWLHLEQNITQNKAVQEVGVNYTTAHGVRLQLNYYLQRLDGFADKPGRDNITTGFSHRVELVGTKSLVADQNDNVSTLTAQAQYAHIWNDAIGESNRYQEDDVLALISWMPWHAHEKDPFPLLRSATFTVSNDWEPSYYVYGPTPMAAPLQVDADMITAGLSLKMLYTSGMPDGNRLEALLQYQRTFTGANLSSKVYEQNLYLTTLKVNF